MLHVGEEDLSDVLKMLKWNKLNNDILYRLGANLHLKVTSLKSILTLRQSIKSKLNQVILLWLKRRYDVERFGVPTWSQLLCAFKEISEARKISRELEGLLVRVCY